MFLQDVFAQVRGHLGTVPDRLRCFSAYEFQAEGWFKGECIALLDGLKRSGRIANLEREVAALGRKKIDLVVDCDDGKHWIELKHWLIGRQKGQVWRPNSYVTAPEEEFEKFEAVKAGDRAWILVLCTARPNSAAWSTAITRFEAKNAPWSLRSHEEPSEHASEWFLGVLQARGLEA